LCASAVAAAVVKWVVVAARNDGKQAPVAAFVCQQSIPEG
jgi:hypothetical protein